MRHPEIGSACISYCRTVVHTMTEIRIGERLVGTGRDIYVVAELSANHGQNFDRAARTIEEAKKAGADAVKLQTYTPDTITLKSDRKCFQIAGGTAWDGRTLHDLYSEACTPWEWQPELKRIANDLGLDLFSSAFDSTAVDFLETVGVPIHKVASFELVDLPLIEKMARTGKPLILSTGMATLAEVTEAVTAAQNAGANAVLLLKCTSAYPASPCDMNLRSIPELQTRFNLPVGLSDHTLGIAVPVAAVALGACFIEKHLILSRSDGGPDASFSLEPSEFHAMVHAVRAAQQSLGEVKFGAGGHEAASRQFRRSLFVVQDMSAGEAFSRENVRSIRPATGLHTRYYPQILGKRARRVIERGTPLCWDLVEGGGEVLKK
jgi:N-acetylneuraminate synthase